MRLLHPITQYPSHAPISAPSDLSWYSSSSFFRLLPPLPPLPSFHYLVLFHCCSRSFSFRSLLPILPLLLFFSSYFLPSVHSATSHLLLLLLFVSLPLPSPSLTSFISHPSVPSPSSFPPPLTIILLFSYSPLFPSSHLLIFLLLSSFPTLLLSSSSFPPLSNYG